MEVTVYAKTGEAIIIKAEPCEEYLHEITVTFPGVVGVTKYDTTDPAVAIAYGRDTFLPDIRRNDKKLAGLVFEWEVTPEVIPDGQV